MLYTVADFLLQVERRSFMPSNQSTFTDAEILEIASEELRSHVYPALLNVNQEYFVYYKDEDIVSNQDGYYMPESAYNSTLREVQFVLSNQIYDIPQISLEKSAQFPSSVSTNIPSAFFLQNDKVVLRPIPSSSTGALRMYFNASTPKFVEATYTAVISAINTTTKVVSVSSIPTTWVTGDRMDFISRRNGHPYKGIDYTNTLVSGTDITFSSLPSDLAVGDYVSITGESSLIQLPYTLIPVLAQMTAAAILDYAGQSGSQEARAKANEMLQSALVTLTPRVQGAVKSIQQRWF